MLAGLEVIRTLNDFGYETDAPVEVSVWTNEEGSRFAPAMVASGVFAGVFTEEYGHSRADLEGKTIGDELKRIGYLGDAKVGAKTNIGAGTITCNYDGFEKHPTTIGKGVFIGSDAVLVAPVRIGDHAYVAAGSTITENVPEDGLGIGRGRQVNKPGWASRKRRQLAAAQQPRKSSRRSSKETRRKAKKRR